MKKLLGNEFIQGGIFLTAGNFIVSFVNYLFNLLAGKVLGPQGYGDIAALFSYLYIFSVPIAVVSNTIIQKIGARGEERLSYALALENWFWRKLSRFWFLIIPFVAMSLFVPSLTKLSMAPGYVLTPLIAVTFVVSFYLAELNGLRFFLSVAVIGVLAAILKFLGVFWDISIFSRLGTIVIFVFLSQVLAFLVSFLALRLKSRKLKNDLILQKRLAPILKDRNLWIMFLSVLGMTLFNNIDVVFAKQILSATDAGLYGAWSLFAKMIFYVVGPLTGVAYVFFASGTDSRLHRRMMIISLLSLSAVGILSFFLYVSFAGDLITFFFSQKFATIVPYLGAASIFGSCYALAHFINSYFISQNSRASLILPVSLVFYVFGLFLFGRSLSTIMTVAMVYAVGIAGSYLIVYGSKKF